MARPLQTLDAYPPQRKCFHVCLKQRLTPLSKASRSLLQPFLRMASYRRFHLSLLGYQDFASAEKGYLQEKNQCGFGWEYLIQDILHKKERDAHHQGSFQTNVELHVRQQNHGLEHTFLTLSPHSFRRMDQFPLIQKSAPCIS